MSNSLEKKYDLQPEEIERIRAELRASAQMRAQESTPVQPTQIGLVDPSTPLTKFCPRCGASQAEPFGSHTQALKLWIRRAVVEIYQPRGVILLHEGQVAVTPEPLPADHAGDGIVIYDPGGFAISTRRSKGMGSSGQLGYTRTVILPDH